MLLTCGRVSHTCPCIYYPLFAYANRLSRARWRCPFAEPPKGAWPVPVPGALQAPPLSPRTGSSAPRGAARGRREAPLCGSGAGRGGPEVTRMRRRREEEEAAPPCRGAPGGGGGRAAEGGRARPCGSQGRPARYDPRRDPSGRERGGAGTGGAAAGRAPFCPLASVVPPRSAVASPSLWGGRAVPAPPHVWGRPQLDASAAPAVFG